jgi:hypothetical protein
MICNWNMLKEAWARENNLCGVVVSWHGAWADDVTEI